eukprot:342177-Ditylum_brightwellii.AAC.1
MMSLRTPLKNGIGKEDKMVQKNHNKISNTINTTSCLACNNKQLRLKIKESDTHMADRIKLYDEQLVDRDEMIHEWQC